MLESVRLAGSEAYWFQMLSMLLNWARTEPQKQQKAKSSFHIAYISLKAFAFLNFCYFYYCLYLNSKVLVQLLLSFDLFIFEHTQILFLFQSLEFLRDSILTRLFRTIFQSTMQKKLDSQAKSFQDPTGAFTSMRVGKKSLWFATAMWIGRRFASVLSMHSPVAMKSETWKLDSWSCSLLKAPRPRGWRIIRQPSSCYKSHFWQQELQVKL